MSNNNLVQITNRNQIPIRHHLKLIDDESRTRSYMPNIIFSVDSVKAVYCDMEILLKRDINDFLAVPDFNPEDENIEVITEDGKPKYVHYSYWLKLKDDDETYPLSKFEYQHLLFNLNFIHMCDFNAKYPTIEELKEYVKEKE